MSDNPFEIFVDRSALSDFAACPRLGWWSREWQKGIDGHCGGLSPARKSIYLVLGGAVHEGLNYLLLTVKHHEDLRESFAECVPQLWGQIVLEAADRALEEFNRAMAAEQIHVPDAIGPAQVDWKLREARALVEGLVMVAGFRVVPRLIERFRVVEVEEEKRFRLTPLPCPGCGGLGLDTCNECDGKGTMMEVWFESRADALLEERSTGELYVHSWKTSADYGRMEERQFKRDVQGLSEAIAIEQTWQAVADHARACGKEDPESAKARIMGIQMAFLLKGRKSRDASANSASDWGDSPDWHGLGPGLRWHQSPLTHGWRMESHGILPEQDDSTWAWSYTFPKAENKSGKGRLGKGWEPQAIFETYPGGTRQWILDLMAGKWQPECGDPLAGTFVMPEPWARSDREMGDWLAEARGVVEDVQPRAEEVRAAMATGNWPQASRLLNRYFPKNRASCYRYGGPCFCEDLCFGPDHIWQEPLANGYRLREPHHPGAGEETNDA